jgi:N-acetylglucosaminyldiphosphoundecaprenol N-acetyl-beta-D-mannosaminyltransferase
MTGERIERLLYGLPFNALTMNDAVNRCEASIQSRQQLLIGVANAAKIVKVRQDEMLRSSMLECDLLLADGQAIVWASKLLRRPLPERVAGIDLFEQLLVLADRERLSVYLLGAKDTVLTTLVERVSARFPGLKIVGYRDGYFTDAQSEQVAGEVRDSGADMLFLGITSPKKEIFLGTWGSTLGVPILHGVGGSFDIFAGVTKRAPKSWQRAGLEWLYRLLQEPGRMWRRYLTTNVAFIALTVRELVRPTPDYRLVIARSTAGGTDG